VQFGRFDTEEDVMRYMIDPFPWLLMAVFNLDQKHSIAGSIATTVSESATEGSLTTSALAVHGCMMNTPLLHEY
jgi:hypothetical protein